MPIQPPSSSLVAVCICLIRRHAPVACSEFGVDYRDDTGAVHVNVSATNMFNAVTHPAVVIDLPLSLVRSRHAAAAANSSNGNDSNDDTLLR